MFGGAVSYPHTGRCTLSMWLHWQRGRSCQRSRWSLQCDSHLEPAPCICKWCRRWTPYSAAVHTQARAGGYFRWPIVTQFMCFYSFCMHFYSDANEKQQSFTFSYPVTPLSIIIRAKPMCNRWSWYRHWYSGLKKLQNRYIGLYGQTLTRFLKISYHF